MDGGIKLFLVLFFSLLLLIPIVSAQITQRPLVIQEKELVYTIKETEDYFLLEITTKLQIRGATPEIKYREIRYERPKFTRDI